MKNFHIRLREARGSRTQVQVASAIGIKQQAYGRYEKGEVLPGAETLQKICFTLGVSADWLLGLDGGTQPNIQASRSAVAIGGGDATNSVHPDCRTCPTVERLTRLVEKLAGK